MNRTGIDISTAPPYTVLWWSHLLENPQSLYNLCSWRQDGSIRVSDDVVYVTEVGTKRKGCRDRSREIKVDSSEDLERLRNDLLTKPILFHAKVHHLQEDDYVVFKHLKTWTARDTNISQRAEGPRADIGRGLIQDVIWKRVELSRSSLKQQRFAEIWRIIKMNRTGIDISTATPYTVLWWSHLLGNPQSLYNLCSWRQDGTISVSDDVVYVTEVGTKRNGCCDRSREIKVDSSEDLERLRNDLLTKPILFHAKVQHLQEDDYVVFKHLKTWTAELAVLVNTKFPTIQEVLTSKLNQATQAMQEGKRFCLKLKFGEVVMQWYAQQVDPHLGLERTDFGSMTFYIHNCSSPINCCLNPLVIVCCFPLWLFGGSCYCASLFIEVLIEL